MVEFGNQYYAAILWGTLLQTVAPVLIVLFAFSLFKLAGATNTLSGWMTMFGAVVLMIVSLIEITFYITAVFITPKMGIQISLNLIHAVQHLYFFVAAPTLLSRWVSFWSIRRFCPVFFPTLLFLSEFRLAL